MILLQDYYKQHNYNLFVGSVHSDIAWSRVDDSMLIRASAVVVPVYPILIDENKFKALLTSFITSTAESPGDRSDNRILSSWRAMWDAWDDAKIAISSRTRLETPTTDTHTVGTRTDNDTYGAKHAETSNIAETSKTTTENTFNPASANRNIDPTTVVTNEQPARKETLEENSRTDQHTQGQQINTDVLGTREATETEYTENSDIYAQEKRFEELEALIFARLVEALRFAVNGSRMWC